MKMQKFYEEAKEIQESGGKNTMQSLTSSKTQVPDYVLKVRK